MSGFLLPRSHVFIVLCLFKHNFLSKV